VPRGAIRFQAVRGEELISVGTDLPVLVAPVRRDPNDLIPKHGCRLDVGFGGIAGIARTAKGQRYLGFLLLRVEAIDRQPWQLVVTDDDPLIVESHGSRGVADPGKLHKFGGRDRGPK
jgi:hypothetical protein